MRSVLRSLVLVALALVCSTTWAEEKGLAWEEIVKLGPGVQHVKVDEHGNIKSLAVVGQARVSTSLGIAKGKMMAQKKARLEAKAELIKYLKEEVKFIEATQGEEVLQLKGKGQGVEEEGKSIEMTATRIESVAEGMLRGMTTVFTSYSKEEDGSQICSIVLGWNLKNLKAAEQVKSAMKSGGVKSFNQEKAKAATDSNVKSAKARTTPAQSFKSPDASEFE